MMKWDRADALTLPYFDNFSCEQHPEMNFFQLFFHVLLFKIAVSATINGELYEMSDARYFRRF